MIRVVWHLLRGKLSDANTVFIVQFWLRLGKLVNQTLDVFDIRCTVALQSHSGVPLGIYVVHIQIDVKSEVILQHFPMLTDPLR